MTENDDVSDKTAVKSTITRQCPFCDGTFCDAVDPVTDEVQGLMHTIPMCKQFNSMEPLSFIRAVNDFQRSAILDPLSKKPRGKA